MVEPTPPEHVTYQWTYIQRIELDGFAGRTFITSYSRGTSRYCHYLCEVSVNQTLVGSARRIVEIQGKSWYMQLSMCLCIYDCVCVCVCVYVCMCVHVLGLVYIHRRASCSEFQSW